MNKMKNFQILFIIMNGFVKIQVGKASTIYSSSFALGTAKITVNTPMAPTMGTMMRATEPLGMVSLRLKRFAPYLSSSIFCMASSIMSGVTIGSKRMMVLPSLETKNLPKFQRMASPWSKPVPVFW